jgi:hypothetical protein
MFGVYRIKIPGIHFQDQKYSNGNDKKLINETEYSINNRTGKLNSVHIYICKDQPTNDSHGGELKGEFTCKPGGTI